MSKLKYLITSKNKKFNPSFGQKIYMHPSLNLNSKKSGLNKYIWNSNKRKKKDYFYLKTVYENNLKYLTKTLNLIHNEKKPVSYWRIIIGPWLMDFLTFIYDRLESIRRYKKYNLKIILSKKKNIITPNSLIDFEYMANNDDWNLILDSFIIQNYFKKNFRIKKKVINFNIKKIYHQNQLSLKDNILNYLEKIVNFLCFKKKSFLIYQSYLNRLNIFKISKNFNYFQFVDHNNYYDYTHFKYNKSLRNFLFTKNKKKNLDQIFKDILPHVLPKQYLEGYKYLMNNSKNKFNDLKRVNFILTSVAYWYDETFKFFLADQKIKKTKIIIGQHGGLCHKYDQRLDHIMKISDQYLSWGNQHYENSKILKIGTLKSKINIKRDKLKYWAVLTVNTRPRCSFRIQSLMMNNQYFSYLVQIKKFLNNFPLEIRRKIAIKSLKEDYGWNVKEYFKKNFPEMDFYDDIKIEKLLNVSKLHIGSWLATIESETMRINYPTIIFNADKHFEHSKKLNFIFNDLKKKKLLFDDPKKASNYLISLFKNENFEKKNYKENYFIKYLTPEIDLNKIINYLKINT